MLNIGNLNKDKDGYGRSGLLEVEYGEYLQYVIDDLDHELTKSINDIEEWAQKLTAISY